MKTQRAKGGTALYDAVCLACEKLQPAGGRTAVILLTDGKDENDPGTAPGSKHTLEQTIRAAKEAGVTVFALGLGKEARASRSPPADVAGNPTALQLAQREPSAGTTPNSTPRKPPKEALEPVTRVWCGG